MSETERVTQVWPKELKDAVRQKAGDRGITELTVEAVKIHLGVTQDYDTTVKELNEVKYFAQQLADQIVLGIESPEERLQALMELEFPSWIDTSGWPDTYAARVRPPVVESPAEPEEESGLYVDDDDQADEAEMADALDPEVGLASDDLAKVEAVVEEFVPKGAGKSDDFFAKVMAKAGGKLDDVPGLKVASQIEPPAQKTERQPERRNVDDIEVEF